MVTQLPRIACPGTADSSTAAARPRHHSRLRRRVACPGHACNAHFPQHCDVFTQTGLDRAAFDGGYTDTGRHRRCLCSVVHVNRWVLRLGIPAPTLSDALKERRIRWERGKRRKTRADRSACRHPAQANGRASPRRQCFAHERWHRSTRLGEAKLFLDPAHDWGADASCIPPGSAVRVRTLLGGDRSRALGQWQTVPRVFVGD